MKPARPLYSNDRNAPRMKKAQFSKQVITKELWKSFKEEYEEYKSMSWADFYKHWCDIAQTIRQETVENPLGVKLGSYTGELKLQFLPHKFEAIDYPTSAELGDKVKHLNIVDRGKVAKLKWERRWAVKFNKMLQFYAFDATRPLLDAAKDKMQRDSEKLRVSRNTLGGHSVWRQLK